MSDAPIIPKKTRDKLFQDIANAVFDAEAAEREGWLLADADHDNGTSFEIQRDDEAEIFPDDEAAWLHVQTRALAGDRNAALALALVCWDQAERELHEARQ